MIKIKNSGCEQPFDSVDELQSALSEHYQGQHVTIVYTSRPHGMLRSVFVSVTDTGEVRHSYGDESLVDFLDIKDNLLTPTQALSSLAGFDDDGEI